MIRFGGNMINPRWITSVRVSATPEDRYEVRLRTLDGREYNERYDSMLEAERVKGEIMNSIYGNPNGG